MTLVVATGLETIAYTADVRIDGHVIADLAAAKEQAALTPDTPPYLTVNGTDYAILPTGRRGYQYLLRSELCTIAVTTVANMRPVHVELGAFATWSFSARLAYERTRMDVAAIAAHEYECSSMGARGHAAREPDHGWAAKVSRVDFTVDLQGWSPPYDLHRRMITRARKKEGHDGEWHCDCGEPWYPRARFCGWCGRTADDVRRAQRATTARYFPRGVMPGVDFMMGVDHEGFVWGKGSPLMARVYDKTFQIHTKERSKMWFRDLWERTRGYNPDAAVWRVELQVRREALGNFEIRGSSKDDRWPVETVEDAFKYAASIWRYLAGGYSPACDACGAMAAHASYCGDCGADIPYCKGWMELRIPGRTRRTNWPLDAMWAHLQTVRFEDSGAPLTVARKVAAGIDTRALARQAIGCLASMAASAGVLENITSNLEIDPDDLNDAVWSEAWRVLRAEGAIESRRPRPSGDLPPMFAEKVKTKMMKLRTRG
jgi:hypothetical protein